MGRDDLVALVRPYATEQLHVDRHGGFTAPGKILIILFPSRAGSNYLGQLLSGTGHFRRIGESFNLRQLRAVRDREHLSDLHSAAQWMIDNRGTGHAFGFKAGLHALYVAAELGFLHEVIDGAQFVLLRRRDKIAQAVSRVKMQLSGRLHSGQAQERPIKPTDYDAEEIGRHVERIAEVEQEQEHFLAQAGKPAPTLFYEDICAEPTLYVAEVCELLGLDMPADYDPASTARFTPLRDDLSDDWIARFQADNPGVVRT